MSPDKLELVLYHDYRSGEARDRSGFQNHGQMENLYFGPGREEGVVALHFNGENSRISVHPSQSLSYLENLRIDAVIWLDELGRRRNIIEGFLAFAFMIEEDGRIEAKIYNGKRWEGVSTPAGSMPIQEWVQVTFIYDESDTGAIYLNNDLLAAEYRQLGKVNGVQWPFGISIGAWPDADSFVFQGKMEQIKLWCSGGTKLPWSKIVEGHEKSRIGLFHSHTNDPA